MAIEHLRNRERLELCLLIFIHVVVCCISLVRVAAFRSLIAFDPSQFHIFFDTAHLPLALAATGAFAVVAILFTLARFSFGYFAGFYFYTIVLNYLWLHSFTDLHYDHRLAGTSIALSDFETRWRCRSC
jgi:hypothetical protein